MHGMTSLDCRNAVENKNGKNSFLGGKKNISQSKIHAVSQGLALYLVAPLPELPVKQMIQHPWIAGMRWKTKNGKNAFLGGKKNISFMMFYGT
jgi:hypothetical protein